VLIFREINGINYDVYYLKTMKISIGKFLHSTLYPEDTINCPRLTKAIPRIFQ